MLERGDSWRSVRSYLLRKTEDENQVNDLVKVLSEMEREGLIVIQQDKTKSNKRTRNLIAGFILMGVGVFSFSFLWYSGWLVGLPIIIFVAGMIVINGGDPSTLFVRK